MSTVSDCRNESAPFALPFGGAFLWVVRGLGAIARAYEGRRMLRQLANSDDRMLKDIGLDRSDLRNAAAQPLFSDPMETLADHVKEARPRRRARARAFIANLDQGTNRYY